MATYNIIDNKIQISFSGKPDVAIRTLMKANGIRWNRAKQLWIGDLTPDREEIANRVVELSEAEKRAELESVIPDLTISDDSTLDEIIAYSVENDDESERLERKVYSLMDNNPDCIVDLINQYKSDIKAIECKQTEYFEVKQALKRLSSSKTFISKKGEIIKKTVTDYMFSNGLSEQECRDSRIVLTSMPSYVISQEYIQKQMEKLNLPSYIKVEFSLDKEALKEIDGTPDNVELIESHSIRLAGKNN